MSDIKHANFLLNMAGKDLKALKGMQDNNVFAEEIGRPVRCSLPCKRFHCLLPVW